MLHILISLSVFIILTLIYFIFIKNSFPDNGNPFTFDQIFTLYENYKTSNVIYDAIYFIILVIIQIIINLFYVSNTCEKKIENGIVYSLLFTIIPWVFIFGSTILLLTMFPHIKTIFGNIFGYYANNSNIFELAKKHLDDSKLSQNTNIISEMLFINELTPDDFINLKESELLVSYMNLLNNSDNLKSLKNIIFGKERIGEFVWFLYSGIFTISLVSYTIAKYNC